MDREEVIGKGLVSPLVDDWRHSVNGAVNHYEVTRLIGRNEATVKGRL